MTTFNRVGLFARKGDAHVSATLNALISQLHDHDLAVVADPDTAALADPKQHRHIEIAPISKGMDLVIAIGGDGTMLSAARALFRYDKVHLLGINLGRLGFLTDLSPEQLPQGLEEILHGNYVVDERFFLNCSVVRDGAEIMNAEALNDVAILKWNTARLISFDTFIDDKFVHNQRADGMIIATPTGSTAYALSGGGPIVHPGIGAIGLVPICPHTLTNRPLVIANDSLIEIAVRTSHDDEARITCDGDDVAMLNPGDRLKIKKHERTISLIHPANHNHFATLRAKLHWGRDPC